MLPGVAGHGDQRRSREGRLGVPRGRDATSGCEPTEGFLRSGWRRQKPAPRPRLAGEGPGRRPLCRAAGCVRRVSTVPALHHHWTVGGVPNVAAVVIRGRPRPGGRRQAGSLTFVAPFQQATSQTQVQGSDQGSALHKDSYPHPPPLTQVVRVGGHRSEGCPHKRCKSSRLVGDFAGAKLSRRRPATVALPAWWPTENR